MKVISIQVEETPDKSVVTYLPGELHIAPEGVYRSVGHEEPDRVGARILVLYPSGGTAWSPFRVILCIGMGNIYVPNMTLWHGPFVRTEEQVHLGVG